MTARASFDGAAPATAAWGTAYTVLDAPARAWEYGPEDADQTLIGIHGFRGDHHGLALLASHLRRTRMIVPDLPGFGATPPLPGAEHTVQTYARWVRAFAAHVAPGAAILGHSFGSVITAAAVAGGMRAPQMILFNPIAAPPLDGPRAALARLARLYYGASARLPRSIGERLLRSRAIVRVMSEAMTKTDDPELRTWIREEHDRRFSGFADRDVLAQAFRASVTDDVRAYAGRIATPTLLIAGELDDIAPIAAQRSLAPVFQHATLVELVGTGHLAHYEQPREAAAVIEAFLAHPPRFDR